MEYRDLVGVDIGRLSEDSLLEYDLDELHHDLIERLRSLPYHQYLSFVGKFMPSIRDVLDSELGGPGLLLVNASIDLADQASRGIDMSSAARRLLSGWESFTGGPEREGMAETDVDMGLQYACITLTLEISDPSFRYTSATSLADAAYNAVDPEVAGVNIGLLLRFNVDLRT